MQKDKCVWLMVVRQMKDELNYVAVEFGWQSTAVDGTTMMQWLCADSWDTIMNVGECLVESQSEIATHIMLKVMLMHTVQ